MLKKIRITVAVLMFAAITFYFLDFVGVLSQSFPNLARIQFVPALLSGTLVVLGLLLLLTFFFGRGIAGCGGVVCSPDKPEKTLFFQPGEKTAPLSCAGGCRRVFLSGRDCGVEFTRSLRSFRTDDRECVPPGVYGNE